MFREFRVFKVLSCLLKGVGASVCSGVGFCVQGSGFSARVSLAIRARDGCESHVGQEEFSWSACLPLTYSP